MADEDIRIRAELEGALTRDLTVATEAVDELGDEAQETAAQLAIMDAAAKGTSRSVADLGRESRSSSRDVDELAKSHRRATITGREHVSALSRFDKILKRIKGNKFDFGAVLNAYKIPAIVTAVSLLGTAVSALGAAGYAGIAGLAPLGSLLVAYPGFALAAAQGLGAVKLGLNGIGDAVKALSDPAADPEKVAAALKDLSPAARDLAFELASLNKGPLKELKKATSSAIAPGFTKALQNINPLWPIITRNVSATGGAIGDLAAQSTKAMSKPFFRGQLNRVMKTNTVVVSNSGRAIYFLVRTLFNLLDAFRPVLRSMSEYLLRGSKFLATTTRAGLETGRLGAFFQRAWRLGRAFFAVIRDLTVGLFNIGQESQQMGKFLGGGLQEGAAAFRSWTDSLEGRASIRKWFSDAIPVVREVLRLTGAILTMFGNLSTNQSLVPVLAQIRTELLPAMSGLATNVTTAFGPALVSAATAFVNFNNALTFSPLATVLQLVADLVNAVAIGVMALPSPLNTAFASLLALSLGLKVASGGAGLLLKGFSPLIGVTTGFTGSAAAAGKELTGWHKIGGAAKGKLDQLKVGLSGADEAQSAFATRTTKAGAALRKFGKWASLTARMKLASMLITTGNAARFMWLAITGPIGLTIIAIMAVVGLGVLLYKKWKPFRELVDAVWAGIVVGAKWVWSAVKMYLTLLWKFWSTVFKVIWGIAKVAFAIIGTLFMTWWTYVVKPIVTRLWQSFQQAWGIIKAGARVVGSIIGAVFGWVAARARWVWNVLKVGFRVAQAVISAVWGRLRSTFAGPFSWLREKAGDAIGWVRDRFKWLADRIRAIFGPVKTFLGSVWDGMKTGFSSALDWIKARITDVIDVINGMIGGFNKLPGPNIDKIPALYAGGPTHPGMRALVGEIGPEAWVKASGAVEIIGKNGPEVRNFASSGYVLPSSVLQAASAETDSKLPSALLATLARSTQPTASAPAASSTVIRYEDHSVIKIEVPAGTGAATRDLVEAVAKAVEDLQRNREERLIHHGWKDER